MGKFLANCKTQIGT